MSPTRLHCAGTLPLLSLILGLLTGCGGGPSGSESAGTVTDPGRGAFESIVLPAGKTVGADPKALASALYGSAEPVEGNYTEEAVNLSDSEGGQIVLFTRLGLADDSLLGLRYRLEVLAQGGEWKLTWAGRQVTCWPERGHEDWSTTPCL